MRFLRIALFVVLPAVFAEAAPVALQQDFNHRCANLFQPLVQPLELQRLQIQPPDLQVSDHAAPAVTFSLEKFRDQEIKSSNLSLDQVLDALEPTADEQQDQMIKFVHFLNPAWDARTVRAQLKIRNSLWKRIKSTFIRTAKPLSAAQNLLRAEFVVRFELTEIGRPAIGTPEDLSNAIWGVGQNHKIRLRLESASSYAERASIIEQYLKFESEIRGWSRVPAADFASAFLAFNSDEALRTSIRSMLVEFPNGPWTPMLISTMLDKSKISLAEVIDVAESARLDRTNRSLWDSLINRVLQTKGDLKLAEASERWFDHLVTTDFRAALAFAGASASLRNSVRFPQESVEIYKNLLLHGKSPGARALVFNLLLEDMPEILVAYVGADGATSTKIKTLIELTPSTAAARSALESYLVTVHASLASRSDLQRRIERKYPNILSEKAKAILVDFNHAQDAADELRLTSEMVTAQDVVNVELERALSTVLKANAPPARYAKEPRPWTAYLQSIPILVRSNHVLQLLERNSGSVGALSEFVAKLDPIPGIPAAVRQHLRRCRYMNSERTDFSQQQITAMFGGARFTKFFPHVKGAILEGTIRTKFIVAVRTDPSGPGPSLSRDWLSIKLDDNGVRDGIPSVFGFRPVLQYTRLITHINDLNDRTLSPVYAPANEQIRGLIVQGYYERAGHSLMDRLRRERGQDQVEVTGPAVVEAIEASLRVGALSRQPRLIRSLFAKYWSLNTDTTLIENIRIRAMQVAERRNDFFNLRVELHNFPTNETLRHAATEGPHAHLQKQANLREKKCRRYSPRDSR